VTKTLKKVVQFYGKVAKTVVEPKKRQNIANKPQLYNPKYFISKHFQNVQSVMFENCLLR